MLAFHGIVCAYGFWLPNDPRGSWSNWVASWDLLQAGGLATKVSTRHSVAHAAHNRQERLAVKEHLLRDPVSFTGRQAQVIGSGFARSVELSGHRLLACAILPEHIHVVIVASRYSPARILGHLKREAALALKVIGLHPFQQVLDSTGKLPSCWAEGCWKVFLDTESEVRRAIEYVECNPLKEGKRRQHWSFVVAPNGIGTMSANHLNIR